MGAWIEIESHLIPGRLALVAPLVGAWIEIAFPSFTSTVASVAPLVGAWIEILCKTEKQEKGKSRSPRGSVD